MLCCASRPKTSTTKVRGLQQLSPGHGGGAWVRVPALVLLTFCWTNVEKGREVFGASKRKMNKIQKIFCHFFLLLLLFQLIRSALAQVFSIEIDLSSDDASVSMITFCRQSCRLPSKAEAARPVNTNVNNFWGQWAKQYLSRLIFTNLTSSRTGFKFLGTVLQQGV